MWNLLVSKEQVFQQSIGVTIDSTKGSVTTAGDAAIFGLIHDQSNTNDLKISARDAISMGADGIGIDVDNYGAGKTDVTINGEVAGDRAGVMLVSHERQDNAAPTSQLTINAGGYVHNSSGATDDNAIYIYEATNRTTTIDNAGTITGTIKGTDGSPSQNLILNNNGMWNVTGTNNFGTSSNSILNDINGIINVYGNGAPVFTITATTTPVPSSTTFSGIDQFTNRGTISLQNGVVGDTLTITNGGNGIFTTDGGKLYLDADLDTYDSDLLIVDNLTTNSPTKIYVHNTSNIVLNDVDGYVQLVQVQNSSVDDAFTMGARVTDGLYEYDSELVSFTDDLAGGKGYYLNIGDTITPENQEVRDEVVGANLLSILSSRTALAGLPQFSDRNSDDDFNANNLRRNVWARSFSANGTLSAIGSGGGKDVLTRSAQADIFGRNERFRAKNGDGYDANMVGFQVGTDLFINQNGGTKGGIYAAYTNSDGKAYHNSARIGNVDVNATSVGAYFTKIRPKKSYLDAVLQYSHLSGGNINVSSGSLHSRGNSILASLEAGHHFASKSTFTPQVQAQLIYQRTHLDDVALDPATIVSLANLNTVTGRLGVRVDKRDDAAKFRPWAGADVWHVFNATAKTSNGTNTYGTEIGGTSLGIKSGFTLGHLKTDTWTLQGNIGYLFAIGGAKYKGWSGSLGVRRGW